MHSDGPHPASSTKPDGLTEGHRGAPSHPLAPAIWEWSDSTPSTNDRLVGLIEAGADIPDFAVVGTEHQTAGRGRLDRTWSVPAGRALTVSIPVRVPVGTPPSVLGWVPIVTGEAVRRALADVGVEASLKWPNDVLVEGRKICGILARVVMRGEQMTIVIGTGVNVSLTMEDLRAGGVAEGAATSVLLEEGQADRDMLLASLVAHLRTTVSAVFEAGGAFASSDTAAEARAHMATLGSEVRVHLPGGDQLVGIAADLDAEANLVVQHGADVTHVSAGDVVHVRRA